MIKEFRKGRLETINDFIDEVTPAILKTIGLHLIETNKKLADEFIKDVGNGNYKNWREFKILINELVLPKIKGLVTPYNDTNTASLPYWEERKVSKPNDFLPCLYLTHLKGIKNKIDKIVGADIPNEIKIELLEALK